jgi:hypothetical protein
MNKPNQVKFIFYLKDSGDEVLQSWCRLGNYLVSNTFFDSQSLEEKVQKSYSNLKSQSLKQISTFYS